MVSEVHSTFQARLSVGEILSVAHASFYVITRLTPRTTPRSPLYIGLTSCFDPNIPFSIKVRAYPPAGHELLTLDISAYTLLSSSLY